MTESTKRKVEEGASQSLKKHGVDQHMIVVQHDIAMTQQSVVNAGGSSTTVPPGNDQTPALTTEQLENNDFDDLVTVSNNLQVRRAFAKFRISGF